MAEIVTMPKLGFDMAEGTLVRWAVEVGEEISKGDLLAEIETDKATVEVESPHSGVVLKHIVSEDTIVPVNDPIAIVGEEGEDFEDLMAKVEEEEVTEEGEAEGREPSKDEEEERETVEAEPAPEGAHLPDGVRASPLARRMAEDHEINLGNVNGSGPRGRIVKKDIEAYLEREEAAEKAPGLAPPPPFVAPALEDETVPLTRLRKIIGKRMTESRQHVPHFYVTYDYDMGPIMEVRKQINDMLADSGEKISLNDFIVKAVALCLREFPNLNASLGDDEVVRKGHINVGVAVAVEGGLLTVVCKDADRKPIREISREVKEKAGRAREGKVHMDDIEGSTFTTSNVGMYGVDSFTAIINPPEAAILAIGGLRHIPVVEEGEVKIGTRMKLTISVDHRVSDGAEAAEFMQALKKYLEEPLRLML